MQKIWDIHFFLSEILDDKKNCNLIEWEHMLVDNLKFCELNCEKKFVFIKYYFFFFYFF